MTHRLRSLILLTIAVVPACSRSGPARAQVRPGIDVLLTDSIQLVRGRRVGLLTNQTGVDRAGDGDVERLVGAGVRLAVIFSPEHGFRGTLDRENIDNTRDSATGVPIFSLYGTVRAPTGSMLADVDLLLVDLQDIGARPYTYVSTTLLALRAAREQHRRVVVLDRPNPIGGELVQGPVLDLALASFIGMLPVPLRHGMTLGELARLGNDLLEIGGDLVVVPVAGWSRGRWFDQTGLPWVRPSPNMPDLESAIHYPGLVLFEATNLSVGRGTSVAFQVLGAPWLDPGRVRTVLGPVPGVAITDTLVTPLAPGDGKYDGRPIAALRFRVVDREAYDPTRLAIRLLGALRAVHAESLEINHPAFDARAGTTEVLRDLLAGVPADSIWGRWQGALEQFRRSRAPYLLYR